MKTWGRKFFVFVFSTVVLGVAVYMMKIDYYTIFAEKVFWMAIGFISGNAIEHIAGVFKR